MEILFGIPILIFTVIFQTVVASRLTLLHGAADLMLLVLIAWSLQEKVKTAWVWGIFGSILISFVSALPIFVPFIGYLGVTAMTRFLYNKIWKSPFIAMILLTFVGTLYYQGLSFVALVVFGTPLNVSTSLTQVILPSLMLNLLLSLPIYSLIKNLVVEIYPEEEIV